MLSKNLKRLFTWPNISEDGRGSNKFTVILECAKSIEGHSPMVLNDFSEVGEKITSKSFLMIINDVLTKFFQSFRHKLSAILSSNFIPYILHFLGVFGECAK
jgi:hypothetical protein